MPMRLTPALSLALLCGLAACHDSGQATTSTSVTSSVTTASVSTNAAPLSPVAITPPTSCADEIGATAAESRVKLCLSVSPASHPPCNAANTCAMIDDEIARSCALFDKPGAPTPGCTPSPKSSEAAAAVVTLYYSALNAHDYETAWRQWGDNGPPNQTRDGFQAGFAHTRSTHVTIGTLEPSEGGAGSIYQTVPVVVDATLDNGAHQQFTGDYIIRRVNGVDGATPDQLRWHISSAHLAAAKAN